MSAADRFCATCGAALDRRRIEGRARRVCPRCGRVAYRNAKPCAGVFIERGGKLLLVRRAVAPYRGWWDIPGGFLEEHEHPAVGAAREALEETGLRVRVGDLVGVYQDRYAGLWTLNLYYRAVVAGGRLRPGDDAMGAAWFAPGRLPERIAFSRHARPALAAWARVQRARPGSNRR